MKSAFQTVALLGLGLLAGCFTGRVIDQSVAAAAAAAHYHSVNGTWPQTRPQLLASSSDRWPLTLGKRDQVWLRENADGSATVTTMKSSWYGGDGMAVRIVPPRQPSTVPQNENPTPVTRDDYSIEAAMFAKPLGRRLD